MYKDLTICISQAEQQVYTQLMTTGTTGDSGQKMLSIYESLNHADSCGH